MTLMADMTAALLTKLVDADLDGIDWERLSTGEQHLAKQIEHDLVDIEPRGWRRGPGSNVEPVGRRVLASHTGRIHVLLPVLNDLLQPDVGEVTRDQVLAACQERGIQVRTAMLDALVQCLPASRDSGGHLRDMVVEARSDPTVYVFRRWSPAARGYLQTLATSYRRGRFSLTTEIAPDPGWQQDALIELAELGIFEQRGGAWVLTADGIDLVRQLARDPLAQADQD